MTDTIYLDCASGIAGDMLVAALLDLGADEGRLRDVLDHMPVDGFDVRMGRRDRSGIDCCDFDVVLDEAHENHDHDMAWLHGTVHDHEHAHAEGHHHMHRTLADVEAIIDATPLSPAADAMARRTFAILARAEATAHGTAPEKVLFHEVGAVDSIVDIVSAAVCLDDLGVRRVIVDELSEGRGTIRCAHGVMPVPVPAVVAIASAERLPLHATGVEGELVTPTGAALAAAMRTDGSLPPRYTIEGVGLGAGKRDYACPGFLRVLAIEELPRPSDPKTAAPDDAPVALGHDQVWRLECDVDDCSGEALGRCMTRLLEAGAREAHYIPVFTKKGRPAWQLQVICDEAHREALEREVFEGTTTIGIRRTPCDRTVLPREETSVDGPLGRFRAKVVTLPGGQRRAYPEYEDVSALADAQGTPFQEAWRMALAACEEALRGERA